MKTFHYDSPEAKRRKFWWIETEKVPEAVFGVVRSIQDEQGHWHNANVRHARLYSNLDLLGYDIGNLKTPYDAGDRITYNVIESAIDTLLADVTASRPKPMFLTDDGDWKLARRAQKLNQFVAGQFYALGVHTRISPRIALDALAFGTGVGKVVKKHGKPCVERVCPDDIVVDDLESREGNPRQMYQRMLVPREVLRGAFPGATKLDETPDVSKSGSIVSGSVSDMLEVIEAWHLGNSEEDCGRHAIVVENEVLLDEEWERPGFPFVFLRFKERLGGFWGKGVAEILEGAQVAINELLWKIHMSLRLAGPKVFVKPGSELNKAHLDNEVWGIIECIEPPMMAVFESVPPDLFRQLAYEIQNAYSLVGVSMMAARSELPQGMDSPSGKAMRVYTDVKSKRFIKFQQAFEEFHVELSRQLVRLTKECVEEMGEGDEEYRVMAPTMKGTAKLLSWKDVEIDEDQYLLQVFPTNFFAGTPSGRLADIEQFIKVFPQLQDFALSLMDFPDLKRVVSLVNSSMEAVQASIEHTLDTGEVIPPDPAMNIPQALRLAQSYLLQATIDKAPEDRLEALRRYIVSLSDLTIPEAAAGPTPMQGAMTGAPGMVPGGPGALPMPMAPPPTSILPQGRPTGPAQGTPQPTGPTGG